MDALLDLSAVEAECRGVGTAASLGREQPSLANVVAEAICGIKIQVQLQQTRQYHAPPLLAFGCMGACHDLFVWGTVASLWHEQPPLAYAMAEATCGIKC